MERREKVHAKERCQDLDYQLKVDCSVEGALTPKVKLRKRVNGKSRNSWYNTAEPIIATFQLRRK